MMKLMNTSLRLPSKFRINVDLIAAIALILFFANALLRNGLQWVLRNNSVGEIVGTALPYLAVLILCCIKPKKYVRIDFIVLMLCIVAFFGLTLLIHPNYLPYYQRASFGVWDHVLIPYRGIYAFLFMRLFDDPKKLHKAFMMSGYLMLIYFTWRIYEAMKVGYWLGVGVGSSEMIKMQYSVTFGYEVLPFALLFLYCALTDRKMIHIAVSIIMTIMILIGGSRGPVLFIGVFLLLYLCMVISHSKKKAAIIGTSAVVLLLLALFYKNLLEILISIMDSFGFSSRFFTTLLDGTVTDDNNRAEIWAAAIQMIKENPLGYGAMGSRFRIAKYIFAGYPHNIILEILIDYGVIPGVIILCALVGNAYRILFKEKYSEWRCIALPFFSTSCALMGSMTYWSVPYFWVSVAVIVSALQYSKNPGAQLRSFLNKLITAVVPRKHRTKRIW